MPGYTPEPPSNTQPWSLLSTPKTTWAAHAGHDVCTQLWTVARAVSIAPGSTTTTGDVPSSVTFVTR